MKTKIVSTHTADSIQVKQEVNGTVILPPLVFPGLDLEGIISLGPTFCSNFPEISISVLALTSAKASASASAKPSLAANSKESNCTDESKYCGLVAVL
jgi:hypothetical protein